MKGKKNRLSTTNAGGSWGFYYSSRDQLHVTLINRTKTRKGIFAIAGFFF